MTRPGIRSEDRDGVRYVHVTGEVDISLRADLGEALKAKRVDVDLSEVTFIDSTGLGCLIEAKRRSEAFTLQPGHQVFRIIELSGLKEFFGL